MSAPDRRLTNYERGLDPTRIAENLVHGRKAMIDRYVARTTEMYDIEQKVKEVLATEKGARTIQNPFYQAFARQVYAQRFVTKGGEELNAEVRTFIDVWAARGLKESILVRIRDEVFSIPEPLP
jgi:hypothetical protein